MGSCFRLVKHTAGMLYEEASDNCRRVGGVLASLSQHSKWLYIWRVFRFYRSSSGRYIHIGLRSTQDGLPYM